MRSKALTIISFFASLCFFILSLNYIFFQRFHYTVISQQIIPFIRLVGYICLLGAWLIASQEGKKKKSIYNLIFSIIILTLIIISILEFL